MDIETKLFSIKNQESFPVSKAVLDKYSVVT
jgi:hypothetical protein